MSPQKFAGVSGGMAAVVARDVERNGEFLNLEGVVVVVVVSGYDKTLVFEEVGVWGGFV